MTDNSEANGQARGKKKYKSANLLLIGVGTHLTSMIAAGFILGYGADVWLGTTPICMLIFGILGFVGGILKAYQMLTRFY